MKLTRDGWRGAGMRMVRGVVLGVFLAGLLLAGAGAQALSTTTVQGTVYLANGQPASGTLVLSWPAFTTASGQLVTADSTTVTIPADGFVSVSLAPNQGATPAGEYYTAVFYLSDGSVNTQYWVVPSGAQATLAQVQAQVMPAAQAVQTVSKAYVDQAVTEASGNQMAVAGGTLTGPLYLSGDPTTALQAADKHYVDDNFAQAVPLTGGEVSGALTAKQLGPAYQVDQFAGADFGAKLQACLAGLSATYGGTCDARNFTGTLAMGANVTISTGNTTIDLPCATIATANQIIVTAGTRNVTLRGCALRGGSTASGSQGGTVLEYSGAAAMVQVGDPAYAADTMGFHMDNAAISTTGATSATSEGLVAYRTQELDLESLYFLGNPNQTAMTLDGTGNYTGGTFFDDAFNGFGTAVNGVGHKIANPATTDWMNASTFVRVHIDCPTSSGSPIAGTVGINLQQGDGNTFTGGDVEGCSTALHLGTNAQNNTMVGLRNENSTSQVVADAGSSYNNWITGGTMFNGALTDNGTRNSFLDTYHRSFNGLNGDWYGSQQDATVTNHYRLGTGTGNERGLLNEIQTDYGYRWLYGYSDATAGEQYYQIQDLLNNVYRLSIGQYNNGQSSTNNQTALNAAGTGAVLLNGSNNAGTGGVVIGSGGPSETTVATISGAGNAQFNGTLQVGGTSTFASSPTVKNQLDAEIDATLQAGLTTSQKESFTYRDWNGNSQWYMVKNATNDWALNSAVGGLDSFKAYQSTNSGDTYIDASNATGAVRVNYETGAGTAFDIYGGGSGTLYASFTAANSIRFPGLAASSAPDCLQIDDSGYVTNTGSPCGSGSGGSGTVESANAGQIAYYTASGTAIGGMNSVPVTAGGTGAGTAAGGLANLGGVPLAGGTMTGALTAPQFNGALAGNVTGNLTGSVTGNAATATALAATPGQCAAGQYSTGVGANGTANCTQVSYTQIGGTAPTWNQNTTGMAAGFTGALSGDVTGTQSATVVGKINGASVPVSAALTGTNGSGQITAVSSLPAGAEPAHAGDVTNTAGSLAMTVKGINGTTLSGLGTGLLKNTTGTGAPSIAVAGTDYVTPSGSITGTAGNVTGTVLLANGGTGATTAAGALSSLGAAGWLTGTGAPSATCSSTTNKGAFYTSSSLALYQCSNVTGSYAWNTVSGASGSYLPLSGGTMTGALDGPTVAATSVQSSVAPECNAAFYGAVGNCTYNGATTSCTDNTTAIQNAINACYTVGGTVLLPPNPAATGGTTVYYVASTLDPKGVSIRGPLGAGTGYFTHKVAVRGAPGKDVFAVGDPANGAVGNDTYVTGWQYVQPNLSFVWQDFEIIIDDSENMSANYTHRKPGKTCSDVTFTDGSAVVTSTAQCEFNQGDVGQQFTGTDGTHTLTGTIASVPIVGAGAYSTTATLSAEWTNATTSGNSTLYVSVMDMPVTQRIGNVALAYDDTSTVCAGAGPNQAVFRDMDIVTTSGADQNNAGAFFFQGTCGQPYASTWDNIFSRTQWGFVAVESDSSVSQNGALGDLNHFNNWFNESNYPLLTYDGGFTRWDGGQLASALFGPQILTYNELGNEPQPMQWIVRNEEFENAGATGPAYGGWRIEGWQHKFVLDEFSYNSTITSQWDAYASECNQCTVSSPLNLTGALNRIQITNASSATAVNDTGFRNLCSEGYQVNAFNSQQPALFQACSAVNSRQNIAFAHTAAFVANGDETTPYNNQDDLWIWPQDMYDNVGVNLTSSVVADSASETGAYLSIPSGGYQIAGLNGSSSIVVGPSNSGPNLPATMVHVCFRIKAFSGTPGIYLQLWASGTNVGQIGTTLSTSYGTYCFDSNLSGYSGDTAYFSVGASGTTAALAWISVHPWANAVNSTGALTDGGGAALDGIGDVVTTMIPTPTDTPTGAASTTGGSISVNSTAYYAVVVNGRIQPYGAIPATDAGLSAFGPQASATTASNCSTLGTCSLSFTFDNAVTLANGAPAFGGVYEQYVYLSTTSGGESTQCVPVTSSNSTSNGSTVTVTLKTTTFSTCPDLLNTSNSSGQLKGGSLVLTPASGGSQIHDWSAAYFEDQDTPGSPAELAESAAGGGFAFFPPSWSGSPDYSWNFIDQAGNDVLMLDTKTDAATFAGAVTASGLITGANDTTRTSTTSMTNSWTTTGLVLPAVPVSTTKSGRCVIYWQMSSTSYTATFGLGLNNAPTDVWGGSGVTYAAAGTSNWLAFTQSSTSTTAISAATTAGAANTTYKAEIDFVMKTGATNPVTMTIYGETSNSSGTLTIEPGSTCYWLP